MSDVNDKKGSPKPSGSLNVVSAKPINKVFIAGGCFITGLALGWFLCTSQKKEV